MKSEKPQSVGGKATAIISRRTAIEKYYKNPTICKNCEKIINVRDHETVSEVRRKVFCNLSCSAEYNNKKREYNKKIYYCSCGNEKSKNSNICIDCYNKSRVGRDISKGDLISKRNGYQSWRSFVSRDAVDVYDSSGKPKDCFICGYDKKVEICHIKSVASFSLDSMVSQINSLENLVALCPNHHWEFDKGLIKISS